MADETRMDSDGDGLSDAVERKLGTNIHNADSDGDGLSDGFEVAVGDRPRVRDLSIDDRAASAEIVEDLVRGHEQIAGIAEHNRDSDGDGFADWVEGIRGGTSTAAADLRPEDVLSNLSPRDAFVESARSQIGTPYRFGAEADLDDSGGADAFDSSELVQWAAHQAGIELPDGSWNQYRALHESGSATTVEAALTEPGALLFGFSSDPLASPDRPARAYVAISLGNGKVLDVSERAGEVRELEPGEFFTHAAYIPEFHPFQDPWRDTDGDGHYDIDEYISGGDATQGMTSPFVDTNAVDADGDGIPDSTDPTPNGQGPSAPSSAAEPTDADVAADLAHEPAWPGEPPSDAGEAYLPEITPFDGASDWTDDYVEIYDEPDAGYDDAAADAGVLESS